MNQLYNTDPLNQESCLFSKYILTCFLNIFLYLINMSFLWLFREKKIKTKKLVLQDQNI